MRLRDKGIKWRGGRKIILPVQSLLSAPPFLACVCVHFSKSNGGSNAPFFSQTCRFLPVHTASRSFSPNFTSYILFLFRFIIFSFFPNFKISYSEPLNHSVIRPLMFFFFLFPLIPGSQRVLFRWGVMGMQGGWQQGWDRGLRSSRWGMRRGLMLMMVVVMVVMDRRAIVGNDRRGGGEDVGSWGRSR